MSFGETPLANRFIPVSEKETKEPFFPLDIHFCESCRLVSLGEVVDPVVLYRNYIYISSDSKTISDHLATLARTIMERFHPRQHDLVVELGSNTGNFLKLFWNQGLSVLGVEPAENIAAVANANGIRTVAEFYEPRSAKTLPCF